MKIDNDLKIQMALSLHEHHGFLPNSNKEAVADLYSNESNYGDGIRSEHLFKFAAAKCFPVALESRILEADAQGP